MLNGNKILIVEDDDLMIVILQFILKKEGYEISVAKDGLNAIERIPEIAPDMVITDIMIPFRSGLEVISYVKTNYKDTPIIVISSLGEEESTVVEAFKL